MNRIAVVSGIYGDYDKPNPILAAHPRCDYLMFTDDYELEVPGWRVIPDTNHDSFLHPRLAAKWPKFVQDRRLQGYDSIVWIDGSFEITTRTFPIWALSFAGGGIAQFQHPFRDCIYAEAQACKGMVKYHGLPIDAQVAKYRSEGHPEHWGLWATGIIAWGSVELARVIGEDWWNENLAWTYQDQLSEAYVLRKNDVRPATLPGDIYSNPWVSWHDHKRVD